jgi:hypothetical protein
MKQGKKILSAVLMLALLLSMSVCAFAEGETDAVIVMETEEEPAAKLAVKCVDAEGATLRDKEEDYLDLSKDLTVDDKYTRPEIENYTYSKTMLEDEELTKLSITHDAEGKAVITATFGEGETAKQKTLTGSETLLFVYEKNAEEHTHVFDEGKVTKEPTCTEPGVKTFTCSCGETRTEEVPALGHDWNEPSYTWAEDNSACTASRTCKRDASHTESESVKPSEAVTKEATCTEKGEKTLSASFANSAFAAQSKTAEIPALGHDYAHGRCKRCNGIDPNFKPKLTDTTNGRANWGTDYVVTSDAAKKDFQKLLIDGAEVATSDYSVSEKDGNTVVTLKGSAVKKLKVGEHTIAVVSATGTAQKKMNVSDKPKTGDTDLTLWVGLLSLSALGSAAALVTMKKKFSAR